jgi:hypothetical protein
MNEETRKLFSELGSRNAKDLAFRDSWVFVGAKGVQNKSPFEQVQQRTWHLCLLSLATSSQSFPEFYPAGFWSLSLTYALVMPGPLLSPWGETVTLISPVLYIFQPKESLNVKLHIDQSIPKKSLQAPSGCSVQGYSSLMVSVCLAYMRPCVQSLALHKTEQGRHL